MIRFTEEEEKVWRDIVRKVVREAVVRGEPAGPDRVYVKIAQAAALDYVEALQRPQSTENEP